MAKALEEHWPYPLTGSIVVPYGYDVTCDRIGILHSSHPVPDDASLAAASTMLELVSNLTKDDLVIALVSGGGSSLLVAPAPGISLEDKQRVNKALLESGASITEMNCVRKQISAIKGGRLALAAYPAQVLTLLVSDVPGDDVSAIASGPTVADQTSANDALDILRQYNITVPSSVLSHLSAGMGSGQQGDRRLLAHAKHQIVIRPQASLEAAAEVASSCGMSPIILGNSIEGEARTVARVLGGIAKQVAGYGQPAAAPCVLLSGGETTVTIRGNGRGGRNVEFLLALAIELDRHDSIYAIAGDTDGIDGMEEVAGAVIGPSTLHLAESMGMRPREYLDNNDAHSFFERLGHQVITGPTGTNVNDFRAILIASELNT
jgi:hydroxypyruvate reductase